MTRDQRRITLIARRPGPFERSWDAARDAANRIIFLEALTVLRYALDGGVAEMQQDVERVVIDRCATPVQYLELLAALPVSSPATSSTSAATIADSSARPVAAATA